MAWCSPAEIRKDVPSVPSFLLEEHCCSAALVWHGHLTRVLNTYLAAAFLPAALLRAVFFFAPARPAVLPFTGALPAVISGDSCTTAPPFALRSASTIWMCAMRR